MNISQETRNERDIFFKTDRPDRLHRDNLLISFAESEQPDPNQPTKFEQIQQ